MSRSTALAEAVKYLVLMRLSGNTAGLMSVLDYANGVSPSVIEQMRGVTRYMARGHWLRLVGKAKTIRKATAIARTAIPIVLSIEPIIDARDGFYVCKRCGEVFTICKGAMSAIVMHMISKHSKEIDFWTERVIEEMREKILNGDNKNQ
jgi:hypothetical protein